MKDSKKSLLFVFALGVVLTYVVSLFLSLPEPQALRGVMAKKRGSASQKNLTEAMQQERGDPFDVMPGMNMDTENMTPSMTTMMDTMSKSLDGLSGTDFDKAFLEEMIVHHEGAVSMARQALLVSKDTRVITLSKAILATQEKEIAEMKAWRQSLSK